MASTKTAAKKPPSTRPAARKAAAKQAPAKRKTVVNAVETYKAAKVELLQHEKDKATAEASFAKAHKEALADAIERIKNIMADVDMSKGELAKALNIVAPSAVPLTVDRQAAPSKAVAAKKASSKLGYAPPKYEHPKDKSITWTGKGKHIAVWFRELCEAGVKPWDMLIDQTPDSIAACKKRDWKGQLAAAKERSVGAAKKAPAKKATSAAKKPAAKKTTPAKKPAAKVKAAARKPAAKKAQAKKPVAKRAAAKKPAAREVAPAASVAATE